MSGNSKFKMKLPIKVFKGELLGKSAVLFLSTVTANLISLLGYILLSKVYSMEVIGEFFSVFALANIISVFIHFGFAQAIPLMNEHQVKVGVTLLSCVSLFVVFLSFIFLIVSSYVFLVFFAAGILSFGSLLEVILIREGHVKPIAFIRVSVPIFSFVFALACGLIFDVDLIVGSFFFGMSVVVLGSFSYMVLPLLIKLEIEKIRMLVGNYMGFLQFIGPGLFFNAAAYNLPSVVGLHYFGGVTIASYNLAYKFVLAPMSMLGKAIGQAYISNMSHAYRNKRLLVTDVKLDVILFVIASAVSGLIYVIFPWVARIFFEEAHVEITNYAIALIPLVFSMLSVAPLTHLFQFTNNQRTILIIQLFTFLCSFLAFSIAIYNDDFLMGVVVFSFLTLIRYAWVYYEILQVRKCEC